jgi:hypothetical protein
MIYMTTLSTGSKYDGRRLGDCCKAAGVLLAIDCDIGCLCWGNCSH